MRKCYKESNRTGISYMQQKEGRSVGLVTSCAGTVFWYILLMESYKKGEKWQECRRKDYMTCRKRHGIENWKRKHQMALCWELALKKAMGQSWDRIRNERMNYKWCIYHFFRVGERNFTNEMMYCNTQLSLITAALLFNPFRTIHVKHFALLYLWV